LPVSICSRVIQEVKVVRRFKLLLLALFCFVIAGHFVWNNAQAQDQPAEKFFKNIKALKGVPSSQIASLMDSYNKALGVSCEYCHVAGDLPNDSKPAHKLSVRDITMTREINDKYKHAVDCMSCHQGKAKPTTGLLATNPKGNPPGPTTPPKETPPKETPPKGNPPKETPATDEAAPPTKVNYPTTYSGTKVLFPHDTHMSLDCSKCHHTGDNSKCDTCHLHNKKTSEVTKVTFYALSHGQKSERACWGCHVKSSTGPRTCAGCHKK
jgi:hypothetical protein